MNVHLEPAAMRSQARLCRSKMVFENLQCLLFFFFLLLFFFIVFLLCSCFLTTFFLTLWGFSISSFLARSLTKPLGKFLCWSLGPFFVLLLPDGIKGFSSDDIPTTLIEFLSVVIGSGVCSTFIFGVHADHGRVFANKGLRVKTLLKSLLSELSLLPLLEFLQVKLLGKFPLFIVIFVLLKLNNDVEDLVGLGLKLIRVHGIKFKRLDSDAEGNLLFLLKLFLGLGHFSASISTRSSNGFLLVSTFFLGLLGFKHLLSLGFSFLEALFLFFGFLGLLLIFFLSKLLFFLLLLLIQLLLLLSSDLLPLSLLLFELLELIFLLLPGLSPFCDVFLQLCVESLLLLCLFVGHCELL